MLTRSTDCQSDEKTRKPKKQICRQGNLPGCKRPHTASADDRETSPRAEFIAPRLHLMFPQSLASASKKMKLLLSPFYQGSLCAYGVRLHSETSPRAEFIAPRLHLMFPQSLTNHQGRRNCFCPRFARAALAFAGSSVFCSFSVWRSLPLHTCVRQSHSPLQMHCKEQIYF